MKPRDPEVADDDRTGEEKAPDFDGTQTDVLDDTYRMRVVSASENSAAAVEYDNRGRKRIAETVAPADPSSNTFDHLEALTHTEPK